MSINGLVWEPGDTPTDSFLLNWETRVDGQVAATGSVQLDSTSRELLTSVEVGEIMIGDRGRSTVEVVVTVDNSSATTSAEFQVYGAGAAITPLLIILFLAMVTKMVRKSL